MVTGTRCTSPEAADDGQPPTRRSHFDDAVPPDTAADPTGETRGAGPETSSSTTRPSRAHRPIQHPHRGRVREARHPAPPAPGEVYVPEQPEEPDE